MKRKKFLIKLRGDLTNHPNKNFSIGFKSFFTRIFEIPSNQQKYYEYFNEHFNPIIILIRHINEDFLIFQ